MSFQSLGETTRINRCLKQAKFDVIKTFENYSFKDIEIPEKLPLESIRNADFIDRRENLILYGGVGTGKTHLATAIGVEVINKGKRVRFFRTAALVNELVEAKASGELKRFFKSIEKCDLLICDEWGYLPLSAEGAQLLFQVISDCYERRSLIITTNLEFGRWNSIFYDERLTSAIIDRIIHHSYLLLFKGGSYRIQHSTIN
ncbi:IS21-like element helper ATPase IstB [Clostridium thermarum]|uniref:IS21-like element helper ATPase IstB n=1 Tax=Clostridium thermarum TaxID=1716543 RepID=UPI00111F54E5|nr:IS21-like element helper ATPase IstB [Clostridium thermarum]